MSFQFFDVHDVSWGTTGDSKVSTELGVVSSGKGPNKNEVEVTMPTAEADINAAYEDAIHVLFTKPPNGRHVDAAGGLLQDPPDKHFASCRRRGKAANGYMSFILFSVAGLALVRFIGLTTYLITFYFTLESALDDVDDALGGGFFSLSY
ncbi:chitin synthase, class 1 [Tylopilus felleus]